MSDNSMLNSELVKVGLEAADREAAICFLAALLERGGYVKKSFQTAVLERERTFPTGLPTGEINVAISHADAVHVLQSAIAVGVLAKPVEFHQVGDPETLLDVDILKASTQPQEVVELLRTRLEN